MFRKLINTVILALQWAFSLSLAIYLIVPGYTFEKSPFSGNHYYNPYSNWNDNPLTEIVVTGNQFINNSGHAVLHLSPLDFGAPVYALDTVSHTHLGRFFWGYSFHDIQYLISNYRKNHPHATTAMKSDKLPSDNFSAIKGLNMLELTHENDEAYWDTLLNYGRHTFAYAKAKKGFSENLISGAHLSSTEVLKTIKLGKNLMVFSNKNLTDTSIIELPVVRKIEWQQSTIQIDLSKAAKVSLITKGFRLDTLTQSLHLKLIDQDWVRFKINFYEDGITYISNPFFRYDQTLIEPNTIKSNNLRSIFFNLAWLIGIIMINIMVNRLRHTYIYKRN